MCYGLFKNFVALRQDRLLQLLGCRFSCSAACVVAAHTALLLLSCCLGSGVALGACTHLVCLPVYIPVSRCQVQNLPTVSAERQQQQSCTAAQCRNTAANNRHVAGMSASQSAEQYFNHDISRRMKAAARHAYACQHHSIALLILTTNLRTSEDFNL